MQTAILSLLLACCGQVAEKPGVRAEPVHITLNDVDPQTGDPRQIHLTFPGRVGGRLKWADGVIDAEDFDRWIYASESPGDPRRGLHWRLELRIQYASREYELTETQKEKLRLAGKGDVKRFLEQVDQRRAGFEEKRRVFKEGCAVLRELAPLTTAYMAGPFGEGSLFAKTLEKIKRERTVVPPGRAGRRARKASEFLGAS